MTREVTSGQRVADNEEVACCTGETALKQPAADHLQQRGASLRQAALHLHMSLDTSDHLGVRKRRPATASQSQYSSQVLLLARHTVLLVTDGSNPCKAGCN